MPLPFPLPGPADWHSAADWYITEHFHSFVEQTRGRLDIQMLRIYATMRNLKTIGPRVRPYILVDQDNQIQAPDVETIRKYHLVITTLTNSGLVLPEDLQGHFSHILVDEAGQVLETEVLHPLTLATDSTCVVLAGDHIQISPRVGDGKLWLPG